MDVNYKLSSGVGGYALNYDSTLNKIFMGGGGGAGSSHANSGTNGGNGGGIIILTGEHMVANSNKIIAKGDTSAGSTGGPAHEDGIVTDNVSPLMLSASDSISLSDGLLKLVQPPKEVYEIE